MFLASNGKEITKQWCHDPLLHNNRDETVASLLINNEILPAKEWEHVINENKINSE